MTLPAVQNLELYRGDSYRWQIYLWLDTGKTQPADLTGVEAKSEIRDKSGGTIIQTLTCTVTEPNGVLVSISASECANLPPNANLLWDLQLTFPDLTVNTILAGGVTVVGDITDSGTITRMQEAARQVSGVRLAAKR